MSNPESGSYNISPETFNTLDTQENRTEQSTSNETLMNDWQNRARGEKTGDGAIAKNVSDGLTKLDVPVSEGNNDRINEDIKKDPEQLRQNTIEKGVRRIEITCGAVKALVGTVFATAILAGTLYGFSSTALAAPVNDNNGQQPTVEAEVPGTDTGDTDVAISVGDQENGVWVTSSSESGGNSADNVYSADRMTNETILDLYANTENLTPAQKHIALTEILPSLNGAPTEAVNRFNTGNETLDELLFFNGGKFDASEMIGAWNDPSKGNGRDNRLSIPTKIAEYCFGKELKDLNSDEIKAMEKYVAFTDPEIAGYVLSCMYPDEFTKINNVNNRIQVEKMAKWVKDNPSQATEMISKGYQNATVERSAINRLADIVKNLVDNPQEAAEIIKQIIAKNIFKNRDNGGRLESMNADVDDTAIYILEMDLPNADGTGTNHIVMGIKQYCNNFIDIIIKNGKVVKRTPDPGSASNETPSSTTNETPNPGSTTNETPGSTTNETSWGKEGDTHAEQGQWQVDVEEAGPQTEDDNANDDNKGYIDDGGAKPGAGSEQNGTVNPEKLPGGKVQGGEQINGDNAYHPSEEVAKGQETDNGGNKEQAEAQVNNDVGGDNNSDKAEEQRAANGDF